MPRAIAALFALAVAGFPAWRLLALPGYLDTHDGLFQLFRLVELDGAIGAGVLYPRLAPNLALGYDYPVFNYYAPLSAYVAEALKLVGFGYIDAVKLTFALAIVAAGWTMLLFARSVMPPLAAWVAALAYMYLPYLLVDVYIRGALAEALALPLLPLCLWGFGRLRPATPARVGVAGLTVALLLLTHNITALFFLPVLAAYWLVGALAGSRSVRDFARQLLTVSVAGLIGLAASAFYWLPAFLERDLVASGQLTQQFFDYHEHFQPLTNIVERTFAFNYLYDFASRTLFRAGLVQVGLAGIGTIVALARSDRRLRGSGPQGDRGVWGGGGNRLHIAFWAFVLVASLALQVPRAARVWEALPLLAYLQFPWRLLALVGLASALLTGYGIAALASLRPPWTARLVALCAVALLATSAFADLNARWLGIHESEARAYTMQRTELDRKLVSSTRGEYLPRWGTASPYDLPPLPEKPPFVGSASATIRQVGLFALDLDVSAGDSAGLVFDRFYFPGWRATLDGQPASVQPTGPLGLLSVAVPAGQHRLSVSFGDTPIRELAAAIALAGGLVLAASLLVAPLRRRLRSVSRRVLGIGTSLGAGALVVILLALPAPAATATLPPIATDFGSAVRLAGVTLDGPADGVRAGTIAVTLYWQAKTRTAEDAVVNLKLVEATEHASGRASAPAVVVGSRDKRPLFGLRPSTSWEAGEIVRDHQEVALRASAGAGDYDILIGLTDARTGQPIVPTTSAREPAAPAIVTYRDGQATGSGIRVGRIHLTPEATAVPPARAIASGASFGGRIALDSFDVHVLKPGGAAADASATPKATASPDQPTDIAPGDVLHVGLRWQALRDSDDDYAVFVHLLDRQQRLVAQDDEWPHRGFAPTSLWRPGDFLADDFEVRVPADVPPGQYELSIGLYRRADQQRLALVAPGVGDRLLLGRYRVRAGALSPEKLSLVSRLDATFGGEVTLLGAAIPGGATAFVAKPGGSTALTLYWQAKAKPTRDYQIFVHLYDASGKLQAQVDGPPAAGNYPTSEWDAGEIVPDARSLALPAGLPAGSYRLAAGLYRLDTGERLRLSSGDDTITLGQVEIR